MSKKFELTSNLKVLCGRKLFQIRENCGGISYDRRSDGKALR